MNMLNIYFWNSMFVLVTFQIYRVSAGRGGCWATERGPRSDREKAAEWASTGCEASKQRLRNELSWRAQGEWVEGVERGSIGRILSDWHRPWAVEGASKVSMWPSGVRPERASARSEQDERAERGSGAAGAPKAKVPTAELNKLQFYIFPNIGSFLELLQNTYL